MVFQGRTTSLDPTFTVTSQIAEVLRIRRRLSRDTLAVLRTLGYTDEQLRRLKDDAVI